MGLRKLSMTLAFSSAFTAAVAFGGEPAIDTSPKMDDTLIREGTASIARGVGYLLSRQAGDGSWSGHPAITSLSCMALKNCSPSPTEAPKVADAIERGRKFMLSFVQPDGSIWMSGKQREYPTYTTAIVLAGLATIGNPEDESAMRGARKYLLDLQLDEDNGIAPTQKSSPKFGGIGYGKDPRGASHVDLSNTQWAFEALYLTDYLDREPKAQTPEDTKRADLAWDNLATFLTRMQNLPESNDQAWVVASKDDPDYGGFVYRTESGPPPGGRTKGKPGEFRKGASGGSEIPPDAKGQDGKPESLSELKTGAKPTLRSYGSMTYAGLKSMIYAKLKKDDPRVKAAIEWTARNYTLSENPGVGQSGLYYYINTFAKAHSVLGDETVTTPDGQVHLWRSDLVKRLLELQKGSGEWANEDGRWMESNPELVTSYCLLSMEAAMMPFLQSSPGK